jgi:hypothetical protein
VHAIWNDETFLSVVTDRHKLISHDSLGTVVEAVQDVHQAPITALVTLDGGRRIGARITHGEIRIEGDESPIARETWVWLRHDARGSLAVLENAQRMFCTNQLGSLSNRQTPLRVRHTGDVVAKTADLITTLQRGDHDWKMWEEEMLHLRKTRVQDQSFDDFTRLFIPFPIPPVSKTRALNAQAQLNKLWRRYRTELGPNAYAGFQSIAEFEDKKRGARGDASRFARAIQPNPNKDRGLRMLVQVARA